MKERKLRGKQTTASAGCARGSAIPSPIEDIFDRLNGQKIGRGVDLWRYAELSSVMF